MENLYDPIALGHKVKAKIEQTGSYRTAAAQIEIDHRVLYGIAHGKTASVETILRVRKWLTGRTFKI